MALMFIGCLIFSAGIVLQFGWPIMMILTGPILMAYGFIIWCAENHELVTQWIKQSGEENHGKKTDS